MRYFHNDYNQMCNEQVLDKLMRNSCLQMPGYGDDACCRNAAQLICNAVEDKDAAVHFLVGGTQTNLTVISAALRPHQAVIAPDSAHINEHETGAIEATGHKIIQLPHSDGKITAEQICRVIQTHYAGAAPTEHMAQPKMVYISFPTEYGTLYSYKELSEIRNACDKYGLYLYVDGARLGYGLSAKDNDVTLPMLHRLCDAFYIGGTKLGTMFGEAVVIRNKNINDDFRYIIKQHGGMLAKGWLIGIQFEAMFENGLYFEVGKQADIYADKIRNKLKMLNFPLNYSNSTNQVFTTMPDTVLAELEKDFTYTFWSKAGEGASLVRFCTSWATNAEDVDALCDALEKLTV